MPVDVKIPIKYSDWTRRESELVGQGFTLVDPITPRTRGARMLLIQITIDKRDLPTLVKRFANLQVSYRRGVSYRNKKHARSSTRRSRGYGNENMNIGSAEGSARDRSRSRNRTKGNNRNTRGYGYGRNSRNNNYNGNNNDDEMLAKLMGSTMKMNNIPNAVLGSAEGSAAEGSAAEGSAEGYSASRNNAEGNSSVSLVQLVQVDDLIDALGDLRVYSQPQ